MYVIFVLDYSFPSSTAQSNRKRSLIKAMQYEGLKVDVICIVGTYLNDCFGNTDTDINITYLISKYRHDSFIIRNARKIFGRLISIVVLIQRSRKNKVDVVFLPAKLHFYNSLVYLLSKFLGFKIAQEMSEYPHVLAKNRYSKITLQYYRYIYAKLLDGVITMTYALEKFFKNICRSKAIISTVPMSVDLDRFSMINDKRGDKYIAYCGDLSNKKDGVDILIKAFGSIKDSFPDYKLYLIGGFSEQKTINDLKKICTDLKIEDRVTFTGRISANEIPPILNNAQIMALARPSSIQAQGGFPTKLGEYLATKNPVVVTDVGEISYYLKDGISAFISKPDSVESFAMKLKECLEDDQKSKQIGYRGYQVALENFDYRVQAKSIKSFLLQLTGEFE